MRFDPLAHLTRVENALGAGTPDVNGCIKGYEFWAELKGLAKWPRGHESAIINLDHGLLESQKIWIRRRILASGKVWVILGVRGKHPCWFVWDGLSAIANLGHSSIVVMADSASIYAEGEFPAAQFYQLLAAPGPLEGR